MSKLVQRWLAAKDGCITRTKMSYIGASFKDNGIVPSDQIVFL